MRLKGVKKIDIENELWLYKTWLIYIFRHKKTGNRYLFGGWGINKHHIRAFPLNEDYKVVKETVKLRVTKNVELIGLMDFNKTTGKVVARPNLARIKKIFFAEDIIHWYDNPRLLPRDQWLSVLEIKSKPQKDVISQIIQLLETPTIPA